jgi:hypothetical protein
MKQYLLSIYQPDGPPPDDLDLGQVMAGVGAYLDEAKSADVWVFNGGLHDAAIATVVRTEGDELLITDGPYTEGKEHVGGFVVIRVPDLDAALDWAARLSRVLATLAIEVRPFVDEPAA